jgi:hypothetical protein
MHRLALVGLLAVWPLIPQAQAQDASAVDSVVPAFRASFRRDPLPVPRHPALAPGGRYGPRVPPALVAARWAERVQGALAPALALTRGDTITVAPLAIRDSVEEPRRFEAQDAARGVFGPYADIGMELNVRFELSADRFQNLRCSALERQAALSGCQGGFPTITPNPQYAIRSGGVVGQRFHVNVDFNSEREFDANNNLQVWYEGLEDEILRRVEAGNVTFQMPGSRFISTAIPANNFGVQAVGQLGALELRGIYAQQKGNLIKDRLFTVGETTTEPLNRELRDTDYDQGRFFFAVDPVLLPTYPAIDILDLLREALPDPVRIGRLHVYRVRATSVTPGLGGGTSGNQNLGGVRAVACGAGASPVDCAAERAGPFHWEVLFEGRDYYVDPSGTWFALATRLDQADYLAVSYATASGLDTIGTLPIAANPDTSVVDTLRLVYNPRPGVTAASPSFRFEIRSAYRVGAGEVDRRTVELAVTVNQRERAFSGQTYLELLGLTATNDPDRFDQYNRLFPRERDPQQGFPLREQFIVFPHLVPFADSVRLAPDERNDSLYRTPRLLLASQGPPSVFALVLRAQSSATGDRGSLSLNAVEIREGSERLYLSNRLLTRGVDYNIDYVTGTVTFINPDALFVGGPAQVRAQFEERAAFGVAPTAIFGLAAHYDLGDRGRVDFVGMFQNEQSAFTRPPLGFEPSSSFIGGVSTRLRFQPEWLTRLVDAIPGVGPQIPSQLSVSAELALSQPSPNRFGQAFVEEFEGEASRFIPLDEKRWHWGSLPCGDPSTGCVEGARGADAFGVGASFDAANAAALTWQNLPFNANGTPIQFYSQQIDPTIKLAGQAQSAEPALWLMLKPDTVLGLADAETGAPNWVRPAQNAPRWRSLTLTLAETGIDLSRVEFLEFWVWEDNRRVARANRAAILFDFGSVFEDAIAFEPEQFQVQNGDTTYFGARLAGAGRLDAEHDPLTRTWSAVVNDQGILSDRAENILNLNSGLPEPTLPLCSASTFTGQLRQFFFGDLRSRCGRENQGADTEDQDGDFVLDSVAGLRVREDFARYVFPIGDERYFVRDGGMVPVTDSLGNPAGSSGWRLYRIPFRLDTLQVGVPNLRQVQALRLTVVAPQMPVSGDPDPRSDQQIYFGLSRVRLMGSTWLKRADTPIRGIAGEEGSGIGEIAASVVSTENRDLGYEPPPGVVDVADRRDQGLQLGTTQINEQALRLLARGLRAGEHAETYFRFTAAGDKNFLKYRRLRVWARGRGPGWEDKDLEFYVKVGKDPHNFYLYRTNARTTSWEPEVVVEFSRWLALRAAVENAWLRGDTAQVYPGCPDSTVVPHDGSYVMCDGPYMAHIRNPGTAPPNLASVQELAAGILRVSETVFVDQAELWVDDIRLDDVVQDVGLAGALDVSLTAGNLADFSLNLYRRDGNFRQLGEDPSYVTNNAASAASTIRLERLLPASWALSAPLTIRYGTSLSDPFYLNRTDLQASSLDGLRTPHQRSTSYTVSVRRTRRSGGRLGRWLLDPLGVSGSYATGRARSELSTGSSSNHALNVDYSLTPGPSRIGRVRFNPSGIRFRSTLTGASASRSTFQTPVARPADSLIVPVQSLSQLWRNAGSVDFLPVPGLQLRFDAASQRDLRHYGDSTAVGRLAEQGRGTFLGMDIGLETLRNMSTLIALTPRIVAWARPRVILASSFNQTRDPNARAPVRAEADTAGAFSLPLAFNNSRRLELGGQVDIRRLGQTVLPDSGLIVRVLGWIAPVDVALTRALTSTFSRAAIEPSLGYQFALGGLDGMREEAGVLANSAGENINLTGQTGLALPLGIRLNANYQRITGVTWVLRGLTQVPIRTRSTDWPSVRGTWTLSGAGTPLRGVLSSLTTQVSYRVRRASSQLPVFGDTPSGTETTDQSLIPSISVNWAGGILTTLDASRSRTEQLTSGNLFQTTREGINAVVAFTLGGTGGGFLNLPRGIRSQLRYSSISNVICLRSAGSAECRSYVDSHQQQTQLTLDTDLPPNLSAGFQMAYLLNDERQVSRKSSQLVITAFVNFTTTVGQMR